MARSTIHAWVRAPTADLERCELGYVVREPIDIGRALEQHARFVEALRAAGAKVHLLPPLPGNPHACFVADCAVNLRFANRSIVVGARSPVAGREVEVSSVLDALPSSLELERLPSESDRLECSDVLQVGDLVLLGWSSRSSFESQTKMRASCAGRRQPNAIVMVRRILHLRSAAADLGERTVLLSPRHAFGPRMDELEQVFVDPAEPDAASVLRIGEVLIGEQAYPATRALLEARGHPYVALDLSEFRKAEGGPARLAFLWSDAEAES